MTLRPSLAIAAAVAVCAPASALAANHASAVSAATSGNCVNSLYCVPQQSIFAFTHIAKSSAQCSIDVKFTIAPKIEGATDGNANLELRGTNRQDRRIHRTAHPLLNGESGAYRFTKLRAGTYKLTGWYEGDKARLASAHGAKRLTLHCA